MPTLSRPISIAMNTPIDTQRLPIPVGAKYAQRQRGRIFRLRSLNLNRWVLLALIGLLGSIAGALISTQPPVIKAGLVPAGCNPPTCTSFQIQNFTLHHSIDAQNNDVYQSEYGAMVVTPDQVHTAGSTTLNGQDMIGKCTYSPSAATANCSFSIGARQLTSVDTKSASGWDRHYDDGREVKIDWPNPIFALPFALGE